jgi:hypothetical protein
VYIGGTTDRNLDGSDEMACQRYGGQWQIRFRWIAKLCKGLSTLMRRVSLESRLLTSLINHPLS